MTDNNKSTTAIMEVAQFQISDLILTNFTSIFLGQILKKQVCLAKMWGHLLKEFKSLSYKKMNYSVHYLTKKLT